MVRPRRLVRAAPPQLSFRPAGGIIGRRQGSLLDADQHPMQVLQSLTHVVFCKWVS